MSTDAEVVTAERPPWTPSARQRDRDAYRRARTRRSLLIGGLSTVAVAAIIVVVVGTSPGWPATRDSFFNVSAGWHDLPALLRALWLNIRIMAVSEVLVLILAAFVAFVRTLRGPVFFPLRFLAAAYTDVFRGLPLLIVLLLIGYGIPSLRLSGVTSNPVILCTVALTLTYGAYVAEVFRAGIESVHPSQRASARALGLSYAQSMRYVVFPQGVRRVLPPLLNDFVSLQKDTSLVSILGVTEIVLTAQNQVAARFLLVPYIVAGAVFVALTVPLTRLTDWIAKRQGWSGSAGMIV